MKADGTFHSVRFFIQRRSAPSVALSDPGPPVHSRPLSPLPSPFRRRITGTRPAPRSPRRTRPSSKAAPRPSFRRRRAAVPGAFCPRRGRQKKSPLSRRKEDSIPAEAGTEPGGTARLSTGRAEETLRGGEGNARLLTEKAWCEGRRNALLCRWPERPVRISPTGLPQSRSPRAVQGYRAWKYSRGCAQAGQVSGASRPSCT